MSLSLTSADSILKYTYANGIVTLDYKRAKTLALLKKSKGTLSHSSFGHGFVQPIKYGSNQAGSATYAYGYAQAETEFNRYTNWLLTPGEMFQFARIEGATIRRTQDDEAAFGRAIVSEVEGAKDAITRLIEIMLDGDGWGDLAQIGSVSTSTVTTVTLKYPWMARFFEIGQTLVAADSVGTSVLKSPTHGKTAKVAARSTAAGTLTMDADMTTTAGTAWAANDYLFRYGDREDSATATRKVPCGFAAFVPDAAASLSTSFMGVNQTLSERLGGQRAVASASGTMEDALLDMSATIDAEGGATTHAVLGSLTYNKLAKSLVNRVEVDVEDQDGMKIGVKGITISGASGEILCYPDSAFREGRARLFDIGEVGILHTQSDLVKINDVDGLSIRNIAGTDDWMSNLVASFQFYCEAPGHVGVVTGL